MRKGQITLNFNSHFRKLIQENFGIVDEEQIKNLILDFLTKGIQKDNIDEKIKRQKLLKLTLENWNLLKLNGTIFEDAKQIVLLEKGLEEPELKFNEKGTSQEFAKGLDEKFFCVVCNHEHFGIGTIKNCKTCNCGIRG